MPRIAIPKRENVPAAAQPMLDAVEKQIGFVPNVHRLLSISPNTLAGFLGLQREMSKTLDVKTRDAIALAVSQADGCDYCLAAHSCMAANFAKLTPEEIALNRQGKSADPKRAAAVQFAKRLVETRGKVADGDLAYCRAAGFRDSEIVEMIALSVQYLLTNFMNNVAATEIDFPGWEARARAE
jgi:uncharacterized peroxidase-related enzyme